MGARIMKSAAKQKVPVPTLASRIRELEEEADAELDRLAEKHRPPNVPAGWMRVNWMARGAGSVFAAYLAAAKELGL